MVAALSGTLLSSRPRHAARTHTQSGTYTQTRTHAIAMEKARNATLLQLFWQIGQWAPRSSPSVRKALVNVLEEIHRERRPLPLTHELQVAR